MLWPSFLLRSIKTLKFDFHIFHWRGYGKSGNLHPEGCLNIRYLRRPVVIYKKEFIKNTKSNLIPYEKIKEL